MNACSKPCREAGFNLIELLVVLALGAILVGFGMPALDRAIQHGKIEGAARQVGSMMQVARRAAVKKGVSARVVADFPNDTVYVISNDNENGEPDPGADLDGDLESNRLDPDDDNDGVLDGEDFDDAADLVLTQLRLPNGVYFWGAPDGAPEGANALDDFGCSGSCPDGGFKDFLPTGSVRKAASDTAQTGALRLGDTRGNYLEVWIATPATGRVELRKYEGGAYRDRDDGWTWK